MNHDNLDPFRGRRVMLALGLAATAGLGGCALQPAYAPPPVAGPGAWSVPAAQAGQPVTSTQPGHPAQAVADVQPSLPATSVQPGRPAQAAAAGEAGQRPPSARPLAATDAWWRALHDPAIDAIADAAFAGSPTLAQVVARIDEARASLGVSAAAAAPTVSASAGATRARAQNGAATALSTSASIGPSLNWEIDLFGRIRHATQAAQDRLDARSADAAAARLALGADVANGVLSLRACDSARAVLADDIASREKTLALTRLRLASGFAAPADEARAVSGIATVRTNLASQQEQCARQVNALVALSGMDGASVRRLAGAPALDASRGVTARTSVDTSAGASASASASASSSSAPGAASGAVSGTVTDTFFMPAAPAAVPALPATVLALHPNVVSAEREAAAAWADIGVARADRLPRLNLAAVLTGQWIRAAGSTLDFTGWSAGPSLSGVLLDGGAGAANVDAARARYRRAAASLQGTLRSTVQEVENALAAQASAQARTVSAGEARAAARVTLDATQAQWKAGAVSLFELEDSRRQFASAQDAEIAARRDQGQAWVALVKATGGAITLNPESPHHE